jgi:hypothetical protein
VPDFRGVQALNAWLMGHDLGLCLQGPDPDNPQPLLHGIIVRQRPEPHTRLRRWDPVTVWVQLSPDDGSGVREPRRPVPPVRTSKEFFEQD